MAKRGADRKQIDKTEKCSKCGAMFTKQGLPWHMRSCGEQKPASSSQTPAEKPPKEEGHRRKDGEEYSRGEGLFGGGGGLFG